MAKMTNEMIAACYRGGVMVSNGETMHSHERDRIVSNTGMNQASASYYLSAVEALLSNGDIKYDINRAAVDAYLSRIAEDYGTDALIVAAAVCLRRFEETRRRGNTCYYYKNLAEKHLEGIKLNAEHQTLLKDSCTLGESATSQRRTRKETTKKDDWPKWDGPNNDERLALARIITKYVRFLHPEIVEALVEDNMKHMAEWKEMPKKRSVDPSQYLWEGSPCSFPGIRRHSGTKEINAFRSRTLDFQNAIALDDNSYPKQIWSYVFRDAGFANYGPEGYQLAHLVDHKDTYGRLSVELVSENGNAIEAIPGLFTCPTNTAYVPTDFLKPTDFEGNLRNLLQRKAFELYSGVCAPLPPGIQIASSHETGWGIEDFEWADPVGTLDHMDDFLRYRQEKLTSLFDARH